MPQIKGSLDTNLLLRWLTGDVPEQAMLVDQLLASGSFRASNLMFAEIAYVLERSWGWSREDVCTNIELVLGHPAIFSNKLLISRAAALYVGRPSLSFVDCCLAVEAELTEALPLYTFDKKLVNQSDGLAALVS